MRIALNADTSAGALARGAGADRRGGGGGHARPGWRHGPFNRRQGQP